MCILYQDLRTKQCEMSFQGSTDSVRDVQFSPHQYFNFAATSDNGNIQVRKGSIERSILFLTSRTTVTSSRILEEDACHRARNLCVFSRIQNGTPRLTLKGCVLQRVSLGALSDVTVVLMMRQSTTYSIIILHSAKTRS